MGLLQSRLTKVFTKHVIAYIISVSVGGIAQLGERLHGMQEVSGSIPLTSTNYLFWVVGYREKCSKECDVKSMICAGAVGTECRIK